eukprot:TRINITY_DN3076_c0_g1_i1.p1 TRINITY_DN3076_c0_g1~~TRINITY_DN3076_c0_g1_i1.p1  ORF type:complete len:621 (-),score=259.19 TRINITY_DN3076_c0_g1_i1:60-1853(-)
MNLKLFASLLLLFFIVANSENTNPQVYIVPPSNALAALYPEWAHYHWVWLSSSQANQQAEIQLVEDYLSHNISVGCVNIDSAWSTGFNDFIFNTAKYPDPQGMIDHFHSLNVRVILWVTSMINIDSPNYQYGKEHNYYLNKGKTVNWWHGTGSFIDYTNPEGLAWWHQQMDYVIDMGIDGWKCDGTDPYVMEFGIIEAYSGRITVFDYADSYYRDFYYYTRTKNPEALIMSRPVDSFADILYWPFSPRDVVFSGWVGDQDPTFSGMRDALRNMFHSAWRNYTGFGSDIAGYRSGDTRTKELFIRWAQLGAFSALMENGGNGEHRPWKYDTTGEIASIYRDFVDIHYELVPYLLTTGTNAYYTNRSIITPIADYTLSPVPSSWEYLLGSSILVAPIVTNSTEIRVTFPAGSNWVDWFSNKVYKGDSWQLLNYPLSLYPVFKRSGSIIPLKVSKNNSVHGDASSSDATTIWFTMPTTDFSETINFKSTFTLREFNSLSQKISYEYNKQSRLFKITATAHSRKLLYVLKNEILDKPIEIVDHEGNRLPEIESESNNVSLSTLRSAGKGWIWFPETAGKFAGLWIRIGDSSLGSIISINGI